MADIALSALPQGTTLEANATIIVVQTVGSTVVNQRIPKSLFFSQSLASSLVATNNLSDLIDAAAARLNIGVHNLIYLSGTAAPTTALGNLGDFAFNDNFEWYELTAITPAVVWTLRANGVTATELTTAIATHSSATDPHPIYLTQAEAAVLYAPLGESPGSGARYIFNTSTTFSGITIGQILFNNAASASVTSIAIHEMDRNNGPMGSVLDLIAIGSKLQISFDANEELYAWFNVRAIVDNGAYRTYTVTALASSGTPVNGEVVLGIYGAAAATASTTGGATGVQFTYINTAGTPTNGQVRSADITAIGLSTVSISTTDAQTKSVADVLAKLKTGAIIEFAKDAANRVRGTISADYASGTNSFNWSGQVVYGAITNNSTVYLSIISDPVSAGGGGHVIRDEGIDLPQRGKIDFMGAGVTATDDAAGDRTVVTIAASGGGGGGAFLSLPYQSLDPAAVTGALVLFARANGNPHMRKDDGTVYPITFGAAVAAITGIVVGTSGPVIGSQPLGVSSPYYKIESLSGDGLYSGGFATRNGVDIHIGWPSTAASYTLTASVVKAAGGSVALSVRTNGASATESIILKFSSNGGTDLYKQIGTNYPTLATDPYNIPVGTSLIFIRVTPTSISFGDGILFRTIANSDYASNTGVGYSLPGNDGMKIANFPTLTYSPYLIDDTFTDTTGTLLTAHTSEVGKWLTLFGFPSLKITALGRVTASTAASANIQNAMATSYTITTNYQVELVAGKTMAIIFRSGLGQAALPNYCIFQIVDGFASFYSQTSGTFTLISQIAFNYPTGGQVDIKVVVTPTTLTAIADDGDIYNNSTILTANNTTHATQPGVGLYASVDPNYTFGDFRVVV
jgi:hypothetical protein